MGLSWLSLLGCAEDDAEAKEKDHPIEYNCFCFPVVGEDEPFFIPDGECCKTRDHSSTPSDRQMDGRRDRGTEGRAHSSQR